MTRRSTRICGLAVAIAGGALCVAHPAVAQSGPAAGSDLPAVCAVPDSIGASLERISRRVSGDVGFTAVHIESGLRVSYNGARRFPMASVSKVPMALEYLARVDAGEIDPSERIRVPITDFRPGSSALASWSGGRAVSITVDSLFGLMMGVSDNTATDVILNMSGGPSAATRRVRELGVLGVDVDRSEARTFADLSGISDTVPESELYRYQYFRMRDALPQDHRDAAREAYGRDPRDTSTPNGMADLLVRVHRGAGLEPSTHGRLLDVMTGTRTGPRRLKGLLPRDTEVAHKTGTMAGAVNDVGIITLPDGRGHVAVAAFVNTLHSSTRRRERTIAEMARLIYDYFGAEAPFAVAAVGGPSCPTETLGG
ncbi:MAG: class A beta-lactamase [Gemmatimonadota bacterium]|nr:class A beta-lactamase [Gemmatimonadota bacterium]